MNVEGNTIRDSRLAPQSNYTTAKGGRAQSTSVWHRGRAAHLPIAATICGPPTSMGNPPPHAAKIRASVGMPAKATVRLG